MLCHVGVTSSALNVEDGIHNQQLALLSELTCSILLASHNSAAKCPVANAIKHVSYNSEHGKEKAQIPRTGDLTGATAVKLAKSVTSAGEHTNSYKEPKV